jgi:hypothetical protein
VAKAFNMDSVLVLKPFKNLDAHRYNTLPAIDVHGSSGKEAQTFDDHTSGR